jgi:hypothetical protein
LLSTLVLLSIVSTTLAMPDTVTSVKPRPSSPQGGLVMPAVASGSASMCQTRAMGRLPH